jgi:hypothetical protein
MTQGNSRALAAIFWAGLVCGCMDITAAFVTWWPKGITPMRILRGISAGLLGISKARAGGWKTAALGLGLHFFIAFTWATVFYVASRKIEFMTRQAIATGVLYGVMVYLVMYWVVKPLSLVPPSTFSWSATIVAVLTHIVCVGLPISLVVKKVAG